MGFDQLRVSCDVPNNHPRLPPSFTVSQVFQLQSSCWFQAKTAQTEVRGNLFFNGPRAGINFNDGFGGGNRVLNNVIFNQCRQSGDHGPINSWDRQVKKKRMNKNE